MGIGRRLCCAPRCMRSLFLWSCRADVVAAPAPGLAAARVWKDTDKLSVVIDAAVERDSRVGTLADGWKTKLSEEELETVCDWTEASAVVKNAKFTAKLITSIDVTLNPPAPPCACPRCLHC